MLNKTKRVWLLAAMLAGAVVQANAANIVADPGFENGTPGSYTGGMGDGWVVTAGTGAICNNSGAVAAAPGLPIQELKWPFWIGAIPSIRSLRP